MPRVCLNYYDPSPSLIDNLGVEQRVHYQKGPQTSIRALEPLISISIWSVQSCPKRLRLRLNEIENFDEIEIQSRANFNLRLRLNEIENVDEIEVSIPCQIPVFEKGCNELCLNIDV